MFQVDVDYLKRAKKRKDHGRVVILVFLTLAGLVSLLPLVYLVCTAFKPAEELFLYPPTFFVKNPTLQNFKDLTAITANSAVPFSRYLFNTVLITVAYIFCLVFILTMACYPLSKHKFPGRNGLMTLVTTSLMFVAAAAAIPSYLIITSLGIDIILTFGGIWADTASSTTYIYKEQLRTLGFFMNTIGGGIARTGASAASGLIMTLPSIIIFIIQQSRVMDTMAHSGIK